MTHLRYITIKTQVRRLKYFAIAIKLLSRQGLQKQIFTKLLIDWSNKNHPSFLIYKSQSGEITLPLGRVVSNSLNSYYNAFSQFNLIIEQGNYIIPTKTADVLTILYSSLPQETNKDNTYELSLVEKCFFLSIIIENDYDVFVLIMKLVKNYPGEKLDFFLKIFQENYLKRIQRKLQDNKIENPSELVESLQRITSWRQAKKYSEEYVPQRINWLIDLGFLQPQLLESKTFALTEKAEVFISKILASELEGRYDTFDEDWYYSNFVSDMAALYIELNDLTWWKSMETDNQATIIDEVLITAIKSFSVLGIPRAPAKSTLLLSSLLLLHKHRVVANYGDIIEWVEQGVVFNQKKYIYRKAEREGESYFILNYE